MATAARADEGFQQSLLTMPPQGFFHFAGRLDAAAQGRMLEHARRLVRAAPLVTPRTQYGVPYRLRITSWGAWGWMEDETDGRRYLRRHPETGEPWPEIPADVMEVMQRAARDAGCPDFEPDTVLVNYYPGDDEKPGRLGLHRDTTEQDKDSPIVTLSLGASAVFLLGGAKYADPAEEFALDGGDVIVMAGPARMFYHSVDRLLPKSPATAVQLKDGGRISFTARRNLARHK